MPSVEYEDRQIWERYYAEEEAQQERGLEERSHIEGDEGDETFNRLVLELAKGREIIDIGCGLGDFTLEIGTVASRVVGVDFSERAVATAQESLRAEKIPNVEFRLAEARELPYDAETFDLAVSRRGPATDNSKNTKEVHRVLRKGGRLMVEEIGEKDKLNWKEVFGRGQNYPFKRTVAADKEKLLAKAGFGDVKIQEYEAMEYFEDIIDVLIRLETTPIIPDFDTNTDEDHVKKIERLYGAPKGIVTNTHRVMITATKRT